MTAAAHGLDFWIGDWDLTWDGGGGRNTITRELDGHVLIERFVAGGEDAFSGMSVSVEDPSSGIWRQTWVDSAGSYWAFVGGPQRDGTFVFSTAGPVDAEHMVKRMVFSNVSTDSLDWRWEFSPDSVHWQQRWAIKYQRR